ncbi:hypothetical protein SprV_1002907700 [Sparganum proliferum]
MDDDDDGGGDGGGGVGGGGGGGGGDGGGGGLRGVRNEGVVDGRAMVGAVRMLQLIRRCLTSPFGAGMSVNIVDTLEADLVLRLSFGIRRRKLRWKSLSLRACFIFTVQDSAIYSNVGRMMASRTFSFKVVEAVTIPNCTLKKTKGLTGLGNPADHFVVDFGAVGKGAAQIRKVFHPLHLDSVHSYLRCIVGIDEWRLITAFSV